MDKCLNSRMSSCPPLPVSYGLNLLIVAQWKAVTGKEHVAGTLLELSPYEVRVVLFELEVTACGAE